MSDDRTGEPARLPQVALLVASADVPGLAHVRRLARSIDDAGWQMAWLLDWDRERLATAALVMLDAAPSLLLGALRPERTTWLDPGLGWELLLERAGGRVVVPEAVLVAANDPGLSGPSLAGSRIDTVDHREQLAAVVDQLAPSPPGGPQLVLPMRGTVVPKQTLDGRRSSRSRLPRRGPSELDAAELALYRRIVTGPRGSRSQAFPLVGPDGALEGPFGTWLASPALGYAFDAFGEVMRFGLTLPARWREIAILVTATYWGSRFERYAHARIAREVGVEDHVVKELLGGGEPRLEPAEREVLWLSRVLVATWGRVTDEWYERAVEALGERAVFELVSLVGYYSLLALQLAFFAVDPSGEP